MNGRGEIQTASSAFPRPSIVRLSYMVQRPRPRVKLTKKEIFRRDKFTCQYCGERPAVLTIDHVMPRHRNPTSPLDPTLSPLPPAIPSDLPFSSQPTATPTPTIIPTERPLGFIGKRIDDTHCFFHLIRREQVRRLDAYLSTQALRYEDPAALKILA